MSEISTNIILDGITLALRSAYPEYTIEADSIEQGLIPPAFIVLLVTAPQTGQVSSRAMRSPRFDVLYFPKKGREECYAIADELFGTLALVQLPTGDIVRGTNMTYDVVDNVLHFLASYEHFVYRETEEGAMEDLIINETEGGI